QWLGDVSYSLYLWHWPIIVLLPFVSGGHLGRLDKAAVIVAALIAAGVTKNYIEDPFRGAGRGVALRRPFQFAAAGMALVVGMSVLQLVEVEHRQDIAKTKLAKAVTGDDPCLGAGALADPQQCDPQGSGEQIV